MEYCTLVIHTNLYLDQSDLATNTQSHTLAIRLTTIEHFNRESSCSGPNTKLSKPGLRSLKEKILHWGKLCNSLALKQENTKINLLSPQTGQFRVKSINSFVGMDSSWTLHITGCFYTDSHLAVGQNHNGLDVS